MPFATNCDEFLTTQAQHDYPPPPEMLSAFRKLLSDPSFPTSTIAKEAISPIIANLPNQKDPRWPDCTVLWRTLVNAVDQFTDCNDKLVEFVVDLQKLPDGDHVFRDPPQFRNHWTEFGYGSTRYRPSL